MSARRRITLTVDDPLSPAPAANISNGVDGDRTAHGANDETQSQGTTRPRQEPPPTVNGRPPETNRRARGRAASPAGAGRSLRSRGANGKPADGAAAGGEGEVWRVWRGGTRVASYRVPDELLEELAARSAELQLPVGLIVTAAITTLLDARDEAIEALVDRADDARIQGRRAARRAAGEQPVAVSPTDRDRF